MSEAVKTCGEEVIEESDFGIAPFKMLEDLIAL